MPKSNNELREERILNAASDLFVHYGFDKTTVSDIAREAGVSKGAIYLHFQSKDDLLECLIKRELKAYAEKWLEFIDADPQGGTIGGMYKNTLYAINSSPFMSAMIRQDGRVLGNYLRKQENLFQSTRPYQSTRYIFVKQMQAAGAVRQDMDAKVITHIMNMFSFSLVSMGTLVPQAEIPETDDLILGIAEMMDRALTPANGGASDAGKAILKQISAEARLRYLEQ